MTWSTVVKVWRLRATILVLVATAIVGWTSAPVAFDMPAADGPRVVRDYLIVFLPTLLGVSLIDPTPELTTTLPRSRMVGLIMRVGVTASVAAVLVPVWVRSGLPLQIIAHEVFSACSFLALILLTVPRWGINGILAASLVACLWLLAYGSVAEVLGFRLLRETGMHPMPAMALSAWGLVTFSIVAVLAGIRGVRA